jgi:hypothetical protein
MKCVTATPGDPDRAIVLTPDLHLPRDRRRYFGIVAWSWDQICPQVIQDINPRTTQHIICRRPDPHPGSDDPL